MFCNQCEQAANGTGCNISGICGKKPDVAALQDHLLYGLKSLALYADKIGRNAEIDRFTIEGLFSTVTNVDFEPARIGGLIRRCYELKEKAKAAAILEAKKKASFEEEDRKARALAGDRIKE